MCSIITVECERRFPLTLFPEEKKKGVFHDYPTLPSKTGPTLEIFIHFEIIMTFLGNFWAF